MSTYKKIKRHETIVKGLRAQIEQSKEEGKDTTNASEDLRSWEAKLSALLDTYRITIKVIDDRHVTRRQVNATEPLKELMDGFSAREGQRKPAFLFFYLPVESDKTPYELDMVDEDELTVYR